MDNSDTVKKRIIFVDDDIDILHGLKRMLRYGIELIPRTRMNYYKNDCYLSV